MHTRCRLCPECEQNSITLPLNYSSWVYQYADRACLLLNLRIISIYIREKLVNTITSHGSRAQWIHPSLFFFSCVRLISTAIPRPGYWRGNQLTHTHTHNGLYHLFYAFSIFQRTRSLRTNSITLLKLVSPLCTCLSQSNIIKPTTLSYTEPAGLSLLTGELL